MLWARHGTFDSNFSNPREQKVIPRMYATMSDGRLAADGLTWGVFFCRYLKRHINVSLLEEPCLRDDRDDGLVSC